MDDTSIYAFMAKFRYGVVSSTASNGSPQSALVGIAVTEKLEIIFDTLRSTRKYANLIHRPSCSFIVGWGGEQSVQFEGAAAEPAEAELMRVREAYFSVWPDGRDRLEWPGLTHLVGYPRWIRYSDFDQSPPLIQERNYPA